MKSDSCAILFSGGTDSTCAAAVEAEKFSNLHLITYEDQSNRSNIPTGNVDKLRKKFPETNFIHTTINTENIVKQLSTQNYFKYLLRYRILVLSNCLFSSLSWHLRTLQYCLDNNITYVADGLTREMLYLPGHMDLFIDEVRKMYSKFGIEYRNTVRDWPVPEDQSIFDRFIVDQHGFAFPSERAEKIKKRSTGQHLFNLGLFPHPNVKGSAYDREMQHDCYPFVFYKIMIFWVYLQFFSLPTLEKRISEITKDKINDYLQKMDSYGERNISLEQV